MTHEEIVMALEKLGYPNGYSFSGSTEDDFQLLVWEHEVDAPTYKNIVDAVEKVRLDLAAQEQSMAENRQSALNKLAALGLTEDEARAIFGGS